jgi:hypothetical protein
MNFYKNMEYTFTPNPWHERFEAAAQSEGDFYEEVTVSHEECFFAPPAIEHVGKLTWKTNMFTYHAAAISSVCGVDFIVVPEGGNGFNVKNFWENQKDLIWEHPEVVYIPDENALDIDDCYH